jgi:hypothetical protein
MRLPLVTAPKVSTFGIEKYRPGVRSREVLDR